MGKRKAGREWSAAGLPHLRDRHVDQLAHWLEIVHAAGGPDLSRTSQEEATQVLSEVQRDVDIIPKAPLYWVNPAMTTLVMHAAGKSLPDWTPTVAMPSPTGFLAWAIPVGTMAWTDDYGEVREVSVDGVNWALVDGGMKVGILSRLGEHRAGVRADLVSRRPPVREIYGVFLRDPDTSARLDREQRQTDAARGVTAIGLLGVTWLLSGQERLTKLTPLHVPAIRSSRTRGPQTVQLVDLRPYPDQPARRAADSEVDRTHRWWVGLPGGFWRQQPWGPGHGQRKPVWIAPFTKGPEDKPLIDKNKVHILR